VPVYVLDGEHELRGRRDLALEWFDALAAPTKELVTYADAGHSVVFEQADAFHRLMVDEIVPATYGVAAMSTTPAISIHGLVKRYGARAALDGLDLDGSRRASSTASWVRTGRARRRRCASSSASSGPMTAT
jgi:hypothetical protein